MGSVNISFPLKPSINNCSSVGLYIIPSLTVVWTFFFFPLYFLVLRTGFERWCQNRHYTVSHSDFVTYHLFTFELLMYNGYVIYSYASFRSDEQLLGYSQHVLYFSSTGCLCFHVLTCIERYVAVVYPVVYLSLKKSQWMWVRYLVIFAIWVFCGFWNYIMLVKSQDPFIPAFTLLGIIVIIISFCSIQVLRTLRNPGPGEGKGASQSKRRAFYTMFTILSILLFWLTWVTAIYIFEKTGLNESGFLCIIQMSGWWVEFPSKLVLPLLFLHRAGQLTRCGHK